MSRQRCDSLEAKLSKAMQETQQASAASEECHALRLKLRDKESEAQQELMAMSQMHQAMLETQQELSAMLEKVNTFASKLSKKKRHNKTLSVTSEFHP